MSREVQPQAVKEVPAEDFIKAYAAHLKSTDKVSSQRQQLLYETGGGRAEQQQPGRGEAACYKGPRSRHRIPASRCRSLVAACWRRAGPEPSHRLQTAIAGLVPGVLTVLSGTWRP
jgi:hypothetical protein